MKMNYLFRKPLGGHVFMTTQDPRYIYTVLCGRCGYPVEECDARCPRCQLELESCPVCREGTHKKAWKVDVDPETGQKTCPVCETLRIPFGAMPLTKVQGSFCRNVYGCRAGGLLLGSNELAVLRSNASICPICRHQELRPLDVRIFLHLVSRCVYCHAVFGPLPTPTREDWKSYEPDVKWLRDVSADATDGCILCGRHDALSDDPDVVLVSGAADGDELSRQPIPVLQYLRIAELGRILILEKETSHAFRRLFDAWFEENRKVVPDSFVPVRSVGQLLLEGTLDTSIHRILRVRVEEMQRAWGERLPSEGLNYRITARDGRPRKA